MVPRKIFCGISTGSRRNNVSGSEALRLLFKKNRDLYLATLSNHVAILAENALILSSFYLM